MFTSSNLVLIAVGAVAIVLVLGLFNMLKAGNSSTSQLLMKSNCESSHLYTTPPLR